MDTTVVLLLTVIVMGLVLLWLTGRKPSQTEPVEHTWVVPEEDDFFGRDRQRLVQDNGFVERVARKIEAKTGCQTAPDEELIRVYKNNKLVGIVKCVEIGRNASPATVRQTVELAQHLKLKTMYLATGGPVSPDTERFAKLQKVKLISL